ncbi:MAG: hypothetical protein ABSA15_02585 [Thermoplasmata archaeon]
MPTSIVSVNRPPPRGTLREEERPVQIRSWPPPRGHRHLTPEAAATVATCLDAARAQAAAEGRTLIYTVRYL